MSIVIPDTLDALLVPINSVRPDPSNVMQHPPSQIDALAASLVAFGFDQPILARRNGLIIAGHGRLLAARQVGMTHVPVVYTDLDGVDATRRMIGDNRLTALAEPNAATLAELLRQLQAEDALGGTGYDDGAVEALLAEVGGATPPADDPGPQVDRAAELQAKWGTALGQVWTLGEHRLVCGDCTDPAVVASVMQGERAGAAVTDPPFYVRDDKWDTFRDETDFADFTGRWLSLAYYRADVVAVFFADKYVPLLLEVAARTGVPYRRALIWRKPPGSQFAGASLDGFWFDFEIIQVFGKPVFRPDKHTRMAVLEHRTVAGQDHGCEKPVELLEDLVGGYTENGAVVLDPFVGSGTTLIACERLGRKCRAVELSPAYVAVTLQRWADMTGRTPLLQSDGGEG